MAVDFIRGIPILRLWFCVIGLAGAALRAQTFGVVSAATFDSGGPLAPEMIATGFSAAITAPLTLAGRLPLPSTLAGYSITIRDNGGAEVAAPLFSIANGQISFL